ncbi:hypothetical protein AAFF_G00017230 [Aldrovandia affinis]|uniref:Uncharacterized protein n=1 Tax=Aldrovandia affinis TaxID=143900 RepID=A0AAD7WGS3_9TELE|nr:hypothetical protein AAFF_G00017230 [Aldrovandia affinis]
MQTAEKGSLKAVASRLALANYRTGQDLTLARVVGRPPLSPAQVQEEQERDAVLTHHVRSWLAAGKRPDWVDVAALDNGRKAYHSQQGGLKTREHRRWRAPGRGADLMQPLVARHVEASGPARLGAGSGPVPGPIGPVPTHGTARHRDSR